jgi:hypothetical protein
MGFGPLDLDDLGNNNNDAYFYELSQQASIGSFAVLLCTQGGGNMWFGGYDSSYASGPAAGFTPNTGTSEPSGEQYWQARVTGMSLGGVSLSGAADEFALVDTGTELFYMEQKAFNALVGELAGNSAASTIFGDGVLSQGFFDDVSCATTVGGQTRADVDAQLPPLTITFPAVEGGSFTISLPATQSYLTYTTNGGAQFCAAAQNAGGNGAGYTVLGDAVLGSNITVFDKANNQIGFVPQNSCN